MSKGAKFETIWSVWSNRDGSLRVESIDAEAKSGHYECCGWQPWESMCAVPRPIPKGYGKDGLYCTVGFGLTKSEAIASYIESMAEIHREAQWKADEASRLLEMAKKLESRT